MSGPIGLWFKVPFNVDSLNLREDCNMRGVKSDQELAEPNFTVGLHHSVN